MVEALTQASRRHIWLVLAAGRICSACMLVQTGGEYDGGLCPGRPPRRSTTTNAPRERAG
jgi:hypothetical protein